MAILKTPKGIIKFKQHNMYLGSKRINKEIADKNLILVSEIMDKNNVYFGLYAGSILGAVREHDFIDWDEDIDLYFLEEELPKFLSALYDLVDNGFELLRYERRGLYSVKRNGEYIDFYMQKKIADGVWSVGETPTLEEDVMDTIFVPLRGGQYRVPRNYDRCLTLWYGDWRTPVQYANFELSKMQIFRLKIQQVIKRMLPNWLYQKMLYRHHRKKREAFFEKCYKAGYLVREKV